MAIDEANIHSIPFGDTDLRLFLREQSPNSGDRSRPVLYVHGFTFSSELSVFWKIDGQSWADSLSDAGFSVWGVDFLGFGGSSWYPEMNHPAPPPGPPLGRAVEAMEQIACAATYILASTGAPKLRIIAHSRGTIPAGLFATEHPNLVERLVWFGPFARRRMTALPYGLPADPARLGPWRLVTTAAQHARFVEDVPPGIPPVLSERHFQEWATAYLATDPTSARRNPASVKVPNGPAADVIEAWTGRLAYDPAKITAPLLVVRGEWDSLSNDDDAAWLMRTASASPGRRDAKLPRGTHLMLLEEGRGALHRASVEFLLED